MWYRILKMMLIFGELEKWIVTKSGHYTLPISPCSKILNSVVTGTNPIITLINMSNKSKHMAVKLLWQFSCLTPEKLLKLLNCEPWSNDKKLKHQWQWVSYAQYVSFIENLVLDQLLDYHTLSASSFQECVAMDLKFYHNKILLHLVDHATRLFATTVKGPRHDNENHLQLLDTDVWISREVPYRQWWRICKQEFSWDVWVNEH